MQEIYYKTSLNKYLSFFSILFFIKLSDKRAKFHIDKNTLSKLDYDNKVTISFKDVRSLAIYRLEGETPNTVNIKEDNGTVEFDREYLVGAILLIKTLDGTQVTINLCNLSPENGKLLLKSILKGIEPVKNLIPDFETLQKLCLTFDYYSIVQATYESMVRRNYQVMYKEKGFLWYLRYGAGSAGGAS